MTTEEIEQKMMDKYEEYWEKNFSPEYVRFLKMQAAQSQRKRYIAEDFLSVFRRIPESVVSDYVRLIAKSQNHEN